MNDTTGAARKSARIAEVSLAMLVCPCVCPESIAVKSRKALDVHSQSNGQRLKDHHTKPDRPLCRFSSKSIGFFFGKKMALSQ